METKKCCKCGRELPISSFYKHPATADGYFGKCKECTKKEARENYEKKMMNPDYVESERKRGREKYDKYKERYKGKRAHKENSDTRRFLQNKGLNLDGFEVHHWNYNRKNDVFIMKPRDHRKLHKYIQFDKETNLFFYNEEILDTKEKHLKIIKKYIEKEVQSYNFEKCR